MINDPIKYHFSVDSLAKLVVIAAALEQISPGTFDYLCSTAAFCADGWNITRKVKDVERAHKTMESFQQYLNEKVDIPEDDDPESEGGNYHTF